MVLSGVAGLGSIVLLVRRPYTLARVAAGLAVTGILWGWAAAQYPYIQPPAVTIADAAANRTTQVTLLVSLLIGSVLLVPALVFLYTLFQRSHLAADGRPG
jgi:cytochrome d ubiquinol oxidase subunit II